MAAVMLVGASIAYAEESSAAAEDTVAAETVEDTADEAAVQAATEEVQAVSEEESGADDSEEPDDPDPEPTPDPDPEPEPEPESPTISLDIVANSTKTLNVGGTLNTEASVTPEGTSVSWESSDTSVASVAVSSSTLNATIKAVGTGTATITASVSGDAYVSFTVNVKKADSSDNNNSNNNNNGGSTTPKTNTNSGTSSLVSASTVNSAVSTYTMPENIPENVALTVNCKLDKNTDTMLDALYSYDSYATFFVSPEKIYKKDDRVRRIVGQGHSIGITLTSDDIKDSDTALEVLENANADLTKVCGVPTRLVAVQGGSKSLSKDVYKALKKAGYRIWDWDYSTGTDITNAKTAAETLEKKLDTKDRVVVRLNSGEKSAEMLTEALGYMSYVQIPTQALADSDIPVCFAK